MKRQPHQTDNAMPPRPFYLVLALLALPLLSGCSVVGLVARLAMDKERVYDAADLQSVPLGDSVQVHRRSGPVVAGRLLAWGELPEDTYTASYAGLPETAAPPLGAPVRVDARSGKDVTGAFQGFVGLPPYLGVRVEEDPGDARPARTLLFSRIDVLDAAGGPSYDRAVLDQLVAENRVPTRSVFVLATPAQEERIPVQDVGRVVVAARKGTGNVLLFLGLALDVTLLALYSIQGGGGGLCLSDCEN